MSGPQPCLLALRVHKTRRHARPIWSGLRRLALRRPITPFGRTCQLVTDVAPPETSGVTRLLRKVASGPPAEKSIRSITGATRLVTGWRQGRRETTNAADKFSLSRYSQAIPLRLQTESVQDALGGTLIRGTTFIKSLF